MHRPSTRTARTQSGAVGLKTRAGASLHAAGLSLDESGAPPAAPMRPAGPRRAGSAADKAVAFGDSPTTLSNRAKLAGAGPPFLTMMPTEGRA